MRNDSRYERMLTAGVGRMLRRMVWIGFGAVALHSAGFAQVAGSRPNAQLADPKLNARVDRLLRQMTLEEKIGQLVQYNDVGAPAPTAANGAKGLAAVNPETQNQINPLHLAETGMMGSMLNTIGAERTNMFQHAAVEKSRLHIPLLFGADVIHGFRTIYPVPLGLAASFDPD